MDLYATKGAINARLVPLVDRLAAAGVTPDAVTLGAVPVAAAGGLCLLVSRGPHLLLALVPVLVVRPPRPQPARRQPRPPDRPDPPARRALQRGGRPPGRRRLPRARRLAARRGPGHRAGWRRGRPARLVHRASRARPPAASASTAGSCPSPAGWSCSSCARSALVAGPGARPGPSSGPSCSPGRRSRAGARGRRRARPRVGGDRATVSVDASSLVRARAAIGLGRPALRARSPRPHDRPLRRTVLARAASYAALAVVLRSRPGAGVAGMARPPRAPWRGRARRVGAALRPAPPPPGRDGRRARLVIMRRRARRRRPRSRRSSAGSSSSAPPGP